ncbi:MAG: threonine aldolase family protein [Halapricum sp.]
MIDLRSDTVTKPSDEMREAAAEAEVGDDVYGEDPTVNELEARTAEILGKEAALYVPSGTMGNQIAVRAHTERGQEVLLEKECHTYKWELGGVAQHSQVQARTIDGGDRGVVRPAQVHDGYVEGDSHRPGTGLLVLENTHNSKGGTAIEPARIDEAAQAAHEHGVPVHLDGARLFNAATALDVPAARIVREVDSVMSCLSKGLAAPVGSMLAGSSEFIERARRIRKLMGGGMRQAGILAAPGLLALENRDRLHEDHRRARELAAGLEAVSGLSPSDPETNIVLVETDDPAEATLERLHERGVAGSAFGEHTIRLCTHWDIDDADIQNAIEVAASI